MVYGTIRATRYGHWYECHIVIHTHAGDGHRGQAGRWTEISPNSDPEKEKLLIFWHVDGFRIAKTQRRSDEKKPQTEQGPF